MCIVAVCSNMKSARKKGVNKKIRVNYNTPKNKQNCGAFSLNKNKGNEWFRLRDPG